MPGRVEAVSRLVQETADLPENGFYTEFFYDHMCIGGKRIPRSEGVVTQRYKYLRYIDQKPVYEELYDLKNDPHETKNLAKEKDHRQTLQSLRKRCDEYRTSLK